jgi:transcriptional regulator NrdR family protein
MVRKNSGSLEPFYTSKLQISIYKALDHRKNAQNDAYVLMQTICARLLPVIKKEILTKTIAEQTIMALKHFDPVGAVKYQSTQTPLMNKRDIRRAIR